ncbi:Crp/Fnr family transcriptional regulator [Pontibacter sp. 13R65]|uniref:Crp/Fnr family transcriptional regulator n=1 Tax=Pontibacter sp. 13R65 TaxID=3127458 RepID=UPI00301C5770
MHETLLQYISQYAKSSLTDEEKGLVSTAFLPKKLRKKQYFLQEGGVCKHFGFIVHGAMRQYSVDEKGIEHVVQLATENWWVGDRESYLMLTPSLYNIDAWEETNLLIVERADLLNLFQEVPALALMAREMDNRNAMASQRRLNAAISFSAEKRYSDFAKDHPEFLQRFPQHLIASYLGITKETLSRIRKQLM